MKTSNSRSITGPRFLFGGAEETPVDPKSGGGGGGDGINLGSNEAQIQEEMALALKYREKMTEKMSGMKLEGSNGGVTVRSMSKNVSRESKWYNKAATRRTGGLFRRAAAHLSGRQRECHGRRRW